MIDNIDYWIKENDPEWRLYLGILFYNYRDKIEPMLIFEVNTLGKLSLNNSYLNAEANII